MARLRQSACWWCFEKALSLEDFLDALKRIGFEGAELVPEEAFGLVTRRGLEIATHRGQSSIERGWNDRDNHGQLTREVLENLKLAETWKIPVLIVFSGNRYGVRDDTCAQIAAEGLSRVAERARDAGVTLALEVLNSKIDHPGYMADRSDWALSVCELVQSGSVKILFDAYHAQVMEGDLTRTIDHYGPMIAHYHVAGNPGRHEPDETQELNYPAIARAIARWGGRGFVGQEFVPTLEPVKALENAFRVFDVTVDL